MAAHLDRLPLKSARIQAETDARNADSSYSFVKRLRSEDRLNLLPWLPARRLSHKQ